MSMRWKGCCGWSWRVSKTYLPLRDRPAREASRAAGRPRPAPGSPSLGMKLRPAVYRHSSSLIPKMHHRPPHPSQFLLFLDHHYPGYTLLLPFLFLLFCSVQPGPAFHTLPFFPFWLARAGLDSVGA